MNGFEPDIKEIKGFHYDQFAESLTIEAQDGIEYEFYDVPQSVYLKFIENIYLDDEIDKFKNVIMKKYNFRMLVSEKALKKVLEIITPDSDLFDGNTSEFVKGCKCSVDYIKKAFGL